MATHRFKTYASLLSNPRPPERGGRGPSANAPCRFSGFRFAFVRGNGLSRARGLAPAFAVLALSANRQFHPFLRPQIPRIHARQSPLGLTPRVACGLRHGRPKTRGPSRPPRIAGGGPLRFSPFVAFDYSDDFSWSVYAVLLIDTALNRHQRSCTT